MKNIFLKKPYSKCGGETSPRPFSGKLKWAYLWINSLKFYKLVLIVLQVESYWNILKLSCRPLAFASYWAYFRNKKKSGTSLPALFFA